MSINTNKLKPFAQKARNILIDGVSQRILFWGFNKKGEVIEEPTQIDGGILIREKILDDPTIYAKYTALKLAIKTKGVKQVCEEVAYTWFNRIIAISILARNGYIQQQMEYGEAQMHTPLILQRARRGQTSFLDSTETKRLSALINDYEKENDAFAILLIGFCHSHILLKNVFGSIDDYSELLLPSNILAESGFIHLLNTSDAITDEDYKQVELIGWLYQFYISDKKDEVFKNFKDNKKAEKEDIPAATQIFTPNWIVKYMVENTVGQLWLDLHPTSPLKEQMKYRVEPAEGNPIAEPIISEITELKLLDPAMGSGHILVEGFDLMYAMYMEELYPSGEAVESILKNNLFGLDIDKRAAQLAQFAILLKAAQKYPAIIDKGVLPQALIFSEDVFEESYTILSVNKSMGWEKFIGHILAEDAKTVFVEDFIDDDTGEKVSIIRETIHVEKGLILCAEIIEILNNEGIESIKIHFIPEVNDFWGNADRTDFNQFYKAIDLLREGQNLGSAIKLSLSHENVILIKQLLANLKEKQNKTIHETIALQKLEPFLNILFMLFIKYEAVATNPPYLKRRNMNKLLQIYIDENFINTRSDLFAVFMEIALNYINRNGFIGLINQHSWMFLSSYEKFRSELLSKTKVISMLHLGSRTFDELSGEVVQSTSFVISNNLNSIRGQYFRLLDYRSNSEKKIAFLNKESVFENVLQDQFFKIQGFPYMYWASEKIINSFEEKYTIDQIAPPRIGMMTTDNERFLKYWFEISFSDISFSKIDYKEAIESDYKWFPYNKGGGYKKWYGNKELIVNWFKGGQEIASNGMTSFRGKEFYFKEGITWSDISSDYFACRYTEQGHIFDIKGTSSFPKASDLYKMIAFLNSNLASVYLNFLNPTLSFQSGDIRRLPYKKTKINENENEINKFSKENISISKNEWNSMETSWDFQQNTLLQEQNSLADSYQKWENKVSIDFFQLHHNEEELNRIFIDIYGLQNELASEVALTDITILQDELDHNKLEQLEPLFREKGKEAIELPIKKEVVIQQLISYAIGCIMGRYRLDIPGLHIAHPNPTEDEICTYTYNNKSFSIDADAIIPIMGSRCTFSDDAVYRLKDFLSIVWGDDTLTENINFAEACMNKDLETYLVKDFWTNHCKMYSKRPIYWLFSSKKGAFQVLAYMHRMNKFTVEKIRSNYLLKHMQNLDNQLRLLSGNSASLSKLEMKRMEQIQKDITECAEYDLYLKNEADKQIEFDLDNGVVENYKLFEGVVAKIK